MTDEESPEKLQKRADELEKKAEAMRRKADIQIMFDDLWQYPLMRAFSIIILIIIIAIILQW